MKAAYVVEHGPAGSVRVDTSYPDPRPGPGEVLVRVRACALNYHDIFTRRGMPGLTIPMPCIMGLDFAGEIVELGADVSGWTVGGRVLVEPVDRVDGRGLLGEMRPGGLAELCAVPAHEMLPLPASISFEAAAALPTAYATAYRMLYTIGELRATDRVLIFGASGGVGTSCVQLAKLAGAEVIACAGSAAKCARLEALGADHTIDYSAHDVMREVYARFGKPGRRGGGEGGVDVVVNFTGGDTWVPSLRILRRGGRLLTCGATAGFDPPEDLRYIWSFELRILGSNGWKRNELEALVELVAGGQLTPIIDRELPLDDVNEAFRLLEDREVFGKVIVRP
jgi:alcohol dehydrogenase